MSIADFSLEGKKAIVIAGSRGIGKGIALALAEAGADVAVTGLTPNYVEETAQRIRDMGRESVALTVDATHGEDMDFLSRQAVHDMGHLDIVVNAAGDSIRKPVSALPGVEGEGMTSAEWHTIININLTEAFEGCRVFGPHMLERRQGVVLNVSSFAARRAAANMSAYAAGKAALDAVHGERRAGVGALRRAGEHHRARAVPGHRLPDGRGACGARPALGGPHPPGPRRPPPRGWPHGRLPRLPRRRLRHRPDLLHRRRHVDGLGAYTGG